MEDLLLNPASKQRLQAYLRQPSHALLLNAPAGFGKSTIALGLTAELLGLSESRLSQYAYFKHYSPTKGSITIEMAREIIGFMKLKTTGSQTIRRAIVIESAETMTIEAQNAILKVIEEPPADTVIIMTVSKPTHILPTIASRTQRITLHIPEREATLAHFLDRNHTQVEIDKSYLISGGLIGLMHALLSSDTAHPLVAAIDQAKTVLKADSFERLVMIDDIAKNKQTDQLLFALKQTSHAALSHASSQPGREAAMKRWHGVLKSVYQAETLQASNAQPKLLLTDLFLSL